MFKFSEFFIINENLNKARSILKNVGSTEEDIEFKKLRKLLANNTGYLGKFTEWMFVDKKPFDQLQNLFTRIKDSNLEKPIDQFKTPEEVIDSIIRINNSSILTQVINSIPSRTREFLKKCYGYDSLENFIKQNPSKKGEFISLFSKKGGRYGDYDEDEVIGGIIDDLEKIVESRSIEEISKISKDSNDIEFIYEDNSLLIVMSNYKGLEIVGSSYWCISEDQYTFDDYVNEESTQLVIFFKDKIPFVEDMSVLGVTWDIFKKEVLAAHWENDRAATVRKEITSLLSKLESDIVQKHFKLFKPEGIKSLELEFVYKRDIEEILNKKDSVKEFKIYINNFLKICDYDDDIEYPFCQNLSLKPFISYLSHVLKNENIKLDLSLANSYTSGLYEFCKFDSSGSLYDFNINEDEKGYNINFIKWCISNGYKIIDELTESDDNILLYIDYGFLSYKDIFDNHIDINIQKFAEEFGDFMEWLVENEYDYALKNKSFIYEELFDYFSSKRGPGDKLKYKKELFILMDDKRRFDRISKAKIEKVLSVEDDIEVIEAFVYNFLPEAIRKKYKINLTSKTDKGPKQKK